MTRYLLDTGSAGDYIHRETPQPTGKSPGLPRWSPTLLIDDNGAKENCMITFRITTEVNEDRRVMLTLPSYVPTGRTELVITVDSPPLQGKNPRTSLAAWAEANAENWGNQLSSEDVESFTGRRF